MPMVISKTTSKLTNAASDSLKATERWAAGLGPDVGALVDVGFMGLFPLRGYLHKACFRFN